jgi:hypothetical protein
MNQTIKLISLYRRDLNKGSENKKTEDISYYDFHTKVVTLIDIEEADLIIFHEREGNTVLKDKYNLFKNVK